MEVGNRPLKDTFWKRKNRVTLWWLQKEGEGERLAAAHFMVLYRWSVGRSVGRGELPTWVTFQDQKKFRIFYFYLHYQVMRKAARVFSCQTAASGSFYDSTVLLKLIPISIWWLIVSPCFCENDLFFVVVWIALFCKAVFLQHPLRFPKREKQSSLRGHFYIT